MEKYYGMETKVYDLNTIANQICANIHNTLVEKGYNPEEGVDIEDILGVPIPVETQFNFYGSPEGSMEFEVSYIRFAPEGDYVIPTFTVCDGNPDEGNPNCAQSSDLYIESLNEIYEVLGTFPENKPKMTNEELYDEVSRVLTNFEHPEDTGDEMGDLVSDLYETLAKVQDLMATGTLKLTEE